MRQVHAAERAARPAHTGLAARSESATSSSPISTSRRGGRSSRGCPNGRTCSARRSRRTCASPAARPRASRSRRRSAPPVSLRRSSNLPGRSSTRSSASAAPACPRASASGSRSRARSCAMPHCCCSMSRPRASTGETERDVVQSIRRLVSRAHGGARRASPGADSDRRPGAPARGERGRRVRGSRHKRSRFTRRGTVGRRRARAAGAAAAHARDRSPGRRGAWRSRRCSGAGAVAASIGLIATSAWLISRSAQHPQESAVAIAIAGVQFFALARGLCRYGERLVGHDAAFRVLARIRVRVYERLERLAPLGLPAFRSGDLLARLIHDVEALQDLLLRVRAAVRDRDRRRCARRSP